MMAAFAVAAFLACLTLVLLGARAAAAGDRPLPDPAQVRIKADPYLSPGEPLVTLPWGDVPGAVGIDPPGEGLRRAPWSLAIASDGRIAVLDAVNNRVVTLDAEGHHLRDIPIALADPRFIGVDDGSIHVLDADTDRRLVSFDWGGSLLSEGLLPSLDVPVSGLFCRDGTPLVEAGHRDVYALDASAGPSAPSTAADLPAEEPSEATPASGPAIVTAGPASAGYVLTPAAGRPHGAGGYDGVRATFLPPDTARVTLAAASDRRPEGRTDRALRPAEWAELQLPVRFPWAVEHLVSLDGIDAGLVLGARLLTPLEGAPVATDAGTQMDDPGRLSTPGSLVVTRLRVDERPQGATPGSAGVPAACDAALLLSEGGVAESGAPYVVAPDGRVFQPRATETGYTILVHTFTEE